MARGFTTTYRTYNWTRKNPVIDKVRTILQDEGLYSKKKRNMLHQLSGVAVATYDGWFDGDTKDPKHTTIAATITALGYEEKFVKTEQVDYESELLVARTWLRKQKDLREKAREAEGGRPRLKRAAANKKSAVKRSKDQQ